MTTPTTPNLSDDICLMKKFAEENTDKFTDSQVNWIVKMRHKNGLAEADAVLKISNKIYIRRSKFFEWFIHQKAA